MKTIQVQLYTQYDNDDNHYSYTDCELDIYTLDILGVSDLIDENLFHMIFIDDNGTEQYFDINYKLEKVESNNQLLSLLSKFKIQDKLNKF